MTEPSDVELARRLGSRDRAQRDAAFATLFDRHRQRAFDLAWRVLGDAALAADAVQEAFLTVYKKGPRFEARAQFSSWLYRVVLNQSIDLRRRERRHKTLSLGDRVAGQRAGGAPGPETAGDPPSPRPSPEQDALAAERAEIVRQAIARLSPKLAKVVVLRYPEGLSYEEIGGVLGVSAVAARVKVHRARLRLSKARLAAERRPHHDREGEGR
jgi:RNA polymerase sigma-70 factor (ECF subfamily)